MLKLLVVLMLGLHICHYVVRRASIYLYNKEITDLT